MITKEKAIQSVLETLEDDMDILYDSIVEREYGWVIFWNTKQYIKTGDVRYCLAGPGGTLVEKETGRHIEFGSAYSLEKNLEIYEKGYLKYDDWDIIIKKIFDKSATINGLLGLRLTYVIPEEEHGTVWRIPQNYTDKQLRRKLAELPVRLNIGSLYFTFEVVEQLKVSKPCEFELIENEGHVNSV